MSSQRGNDSRKRPQKYQNKHAFKNDLHDKSNKIKMIKSLQTWGLCAPCKDIIDWKIKYKKYKPLSQPRTCTRCSQKTVKRAYYIVCQSCSGAEKLCGKCGKKKELEQEIGLTTEEEMTHDAQLEQEMKFMSERQRRSFFRKQASGKLAQATAGEKVDASESDDEISSDDDPNNDALQTTQETLKLDVKEDCAVAVSPSKHVQWNDEKISDELEKSCDLSDVKGNELISSQKNFKSKEGSE